MKRALSILAMLLAAGCASSGPSSDERVGVEFEQLSGMLEVQSGEEFEVQYRVTVENTLSEPVTIRRIEVRQVGNGAYALTRRNPSGLTFQKRISPGSTDQIDFWMYAAPTVFPGNLGSDEPVALRAVVFFEAASGGFRQVVHKTVAPY